MSTATHTATSKQVAFIKRLLSENELSGDHYDRLRLLVAAHELNEEDPSHGKPLSKEQASATIDYILHYLQLHPELKKQRKATAPAITTPGVFAKDGDVYLVTFNQAKTRLYAKKLVESAPRLTSGGEVVDFEWEYTKGVIHELTEADRMPLADAGKLSVKYGRCLRCRRALKAAKTMKTVEATGMALGPVCRAYFS